MQRKTAAEHGTTARAVVSLSGYFQSSSASGLRCRSRTPDPALAVLLIAFNRVGRDSEAIRSISVLPWIHFYQQFSQRLPRNGPTVDLSDQEPRAASFSTTFRPEAEGRQTANVASETKG